MIKNNIKTISNIEETSLSDLNTFLTTDEFYYNLIFSDVSENIKNYLNELEIFTLKGSNQNSLLLLSFLNEKNQNINAEILIDNIMDVFYNQVGLSMDENSGLRKYNYKNNLVAACKIFKDKNTSKIILLLPWTFYGKGVDPIILLNEKKYEFILEGVLNDVTIF